jgi:hypothetical protein
LLAPQKMAALDAAVKIKAMLAPSFVLSTKSIKFKLLLSSL